MKRKLIKRNKQFLTDCIKKANGWPLSIYLYDFYSKQSIREARGYKEIMKEARTKQGRINGSYFAWFGVEPSRICVGQKGKL